MLDGSSVFFTVSFPSHFRDISGVFGRDECPNTKNVVYDTQKYSSYETRFLLADKTGHGRLSL